jgi:serine/threonine-protein kinase
VDVEGLVGRQVGGYAITDRLGQGGFATVYRATQIRLGRAVALKVLDPALARNPSTARRFEREGVAAATLDHPNIVPVYEAGEDDGLVFLAMRLVDGYALDASLAHHGRPTPEQLLHVAGAVAGALDHAHANGIVHRDVKPSNILIEGDHVYLSDFGIAVSVREAGMYTTGAIGSVHYMAPEQARAGEIDGRADLYGLGCVIFECLTGSVPFPGDNHLAVLMAQTTHAPPGTGDAVLDAFVATALAKEPGDRFGSGAEMVAALAHVLEGSGMPATLEPIGAATPAAEAATARPEADTVEPEDGASALRTDRRVDEVATGSAAASQADPARRSSRRGTWVAAAVLLLAVVVTGAIVAARRGSSPVDAAAASGSPAGTTDPASGAIPAGSAPGTQPPTTVAPGPGTTAGTGVTSGSEPGANQLTFERPAEWTASKEVGAGSFTRLAKAGVPVATAALGYQDQLPLERLVREAGGGPCTGPEEAATIGGRPATHCLSGASDPQAPTGKAIGPSDRYVVDIGDQEWVFVVSTGVPKAEHDRFVDTLAFH